MSHKKPIYAVHLFTEFGVGMQAVKANSKQEARAKFQKRFPKKRIIDITKYDSENPHSSTFLNSAF